jgi:Trypsin-like peptidase domain
MYKKYFVIFSMAIFISPIYGQLTKDYVDEYSQTSLEITARNGLNNLWNGTGFIFKVKNHLYLITNNHVVGEEFMKKEYFEKNKRWPPQDSIPNNLEIKFYTNTLGQYIRHRIYIRSKNGSQLFTKFYEKEMDSTTILDVVAIPIMESQFPNTKITWLDSTNLNSSLSMYPGQDLFVVGYPSDSGQVYPLPIWKRGTIASESNLLYVGISWFWIDATTRGGMSGSPVFFRSNIMPHKDGNLGFSTSALTYLVGVYRAQNTNLELGIVTRIDKINEKLMELNR